MVTSTVTTHVASLILGVALAATGTWHVQNWRYASKEADRIKAEAADKDEIEKGTKAAATGLEADKAKIEVKYRTITKTVTKFIDRPVYQNICLDQDGIDAINGVER